MHMNTHTHTHIYIYINKCIIHSVIYGAQVKHQSRLLHLRHIYSSWQEAAAGHLRILCSPMLRCLETIRPAAWRRLKMKGTGTNGLSWGYIIYNRCLTMEPKLTCILDFLDEHYQVILIIETF